MFINVGGKLRRVPPVVRARADDPHPNGGTVIEQFERDPAAVTAWAQAEEERRLAAERAAAGIEEPLAGDALAKQLQREAAERERQIAAAHEEAESPAPTPQPAPSRGRSAPKPAPEA